MAQQVTTVTIVVPAAKEGRLNSHLRKLGERDGDLSQLVGHGWVLTHSHAIAGTEYTTFVDTLTRTD